MGFEVFGVLLALLVPLVTRGSYTRLLEARWRWAGLLVLGLAAQLAVQVLPLPESRWHDVGYGVLVASFVLVLGFCAGNLLVRGMGVVLLGVACNALVITVNQGMPFDVPADWSRADAEATVTHHPQGPGDHLTFLGDIILVRVPFEGLLSFGDLIMVTGLVDVMYHASRRPRRRQVSGRREREMAPSPIDLSAYEFSARAPAAARATPPHPANGFGRYPDGLSPARSSTRSSAASTPGS